MKRSAQLLPSGGRAARFDESGGAPPRQRERFTRERFAGGERVVGLLVALGVICVFFSLSSPYFLTTTNIYNVLLQASALMIVAVGLTIVLITAEIDLSIGSVEALTGSVAAVVIINEGVPVVPGVLLALGAALLVGLINGLVTTKLGVVSFITTLAMLGIAQGVAFLLTNGQAVAGFPALYGEMAWPRSRTDSRCRRSSPSLWSWPRTCCSPRPGSGCTSTQWVRIANPPPFPGSSRRACGRWRWCSRSLLAGVGGLILSSRLDAGNGLFGEADLLNAVAAVVIGGASLFGGVGTVIGTAIGVLIIATIGNGLVLLNVADFWQQIVIGGFILAAVVIDQMTKRGTEYARRGRMRRLVGLRGHDERGHDDEH